MQLASPRTGSLSADFLVDRNRLEQGRFAHDNCAMVERLAAAAALAAALTAASSIASAQAVCDAGATCADSDGDGFAACGCPWSGSPCDCDDADPATFPGAPEPCDAVKDLDCSGVAPNSCGSKKACLASTCVPICIPLADFGCPKGASMTNDADSGLCVCRPSDCTLFGCPSGLTCDESKACVPTCNAGVRCPSGQLCRGFGCIDPCDEVTCPAGVVCDRGRCSPSCACSGAACASGTTCDLNAPLPACVETACLGVSCPAETRCEGGACVDDCQGVVCPPGRVCTKVSVNGGPKRAKCADLCDPSPCRPDWTCDRQSGACSPPPPDLRSVPGAVTSPSETLSVAGAGFLCSATALGSGSVIGAAAGLAACVALFLRRRR